MGTIATLKFGFGLAFVAAVAIIAAFLGYMSIFGKRSSLRQKSTTETGTSV